MKESAYKEAGVDIDAGADLVERIKPYARATQREGVMSGLGGFGAFFDLAKTGYEDPLLVSATDGVGTKLKIAIEADKHDTVGIDLVAMCVNDLIVQGAEPLFFLDYFATGKLSTDHGADVIKGIAEGCQRAGSALIGGETAEMPGMYAAGDYDLAGFSVGVVERSRVISGDDVAAGDVILGLASDGVHSNGYSLVRKIIEKDFGGSYKDEAPFAAGKTFADIFLTPTRIYVKPVLEALKLNRAADSTKPAVKAMSHITGGGLLENIPRTLPEDMAAVLDATAWPYLPLFSWLAEAGGLTHYDMSVTFNCGIGFVLICDEADADAIETALEGAGEKVYRIGHVEKAGSAGQVVIENQDQVWGA